MLKALNMYNTEGCYIYHQVHGQGGSDVNENYTLEVGSQLIRFVGSL